MHATARRFDCHVHAILSISYEVLHCCDDTHTCRKYRSFKVPREMNKLAEHLVKEGLERKRYVCKNCQKSVKTENDSAVNTDLGTDLVAALSGLDVHDFTHSDEVELALKL